MKILTYTLGVFVASLLFATTALGDAFANFRTQVQRAIPAGWVCYKIQTFQGRTFFDVASRTNRFSIAINRHELISQQEWTSHFARMKKAIDSIIADEKAEKAAATALLDGLDLPDGRYGGVALCVDRSEPDVWYPEITADDEKSKKVINTILSLVDLYDKSEQDGTEQPDTRSQPKSEGGDKPQPEPERCSR